MDTSVHDMHSLFEQLGLPSDFYSIEKFVDNNGPLPRHVSLADAPFWNTAQSSFIREAWEQDSDWSECIDTLDSLMRP